MLRIGNYSFEISESNFSCYIFYGERGWECGVNLDFRTNCLDIDDFDWEFHVYTHSLKIDLPELEALSGSEFDISDLMDEEPQMCIYAYSHEPISNGIIRFSEWSGNSVKFNFSGTANFWDEAPFEGDVEVHIDCLLPFNGVTVDEPNPDKATEILGRFFRAANFLGPQKDESGRNFYKFSWAPVKP